MDIIGPVRTARDGPMQLKSDAPRPPTPDEVSFDLETVLGSVVSLRARIPEDAMTASILGT